MSRPSRSFVAMIAILLFAVVARIHQIDAQDIWADEAFTYLTTQQSDMLPMLRADVHPPAYFLAMRAWVAAAGTSELALRLPSALASILTVALIYLLGRELVRWNGEDPAASQIPVLAALLLALSDLEVDLSHEARMYTIQTALATFAVLLYLRWSRTRTGFTLASLGVCSALLVYVNYLGAWTPMVIGLHGLVVLRGKQRNALIGVMLVAASAVLPWLMFVGRDQIGNGAGANRADATTLDTLRVYRDNWFGQQWPLMLGLLGLSFVRLGPVSSLRMRLRFGRHIVFLLLWIAMPLGLTLVANIWLPVLAAHRISQITPAICLLIAFGLSSLHAPARSFLVVVIVISGITSVDYYRIKGPWNEFTQTVSPFVSPDDLVLMEIGGGDTMLEYYFDQSLPETTRLVSLKRWREGTPDQFYAGVLPLLEQYQTVWLLHWSSETAIFDWLAETGYVQTMRRETLHIQDSRLDSYRFDRVRGDELGSLGELSLAQAEIQESDLRVDLFWYASEAPSIDYVTSAFLLDGQGRVVAQLDSQPMLNERPTSTWRARRLYYDPKPLVTADGAPLAPGEYQVGVVVYFFDNGQIRRLQTPGGLDSLTIGTLVIRGD